GLYRCLRPPVRGPGRTTALSEISRNAHGASRSTHGSGAASCSESAFPNQGDLPVRDRGRTHDEHPDPFEPGRTTSECSLPLSRRAEGASASDWEDHSLARRQPCASPPTSCESCSSKAKPGFACFTSTPMARS